MRLVRSVLARRLASFALVAGMLTAGGCMEDGARSVSPITYQNAHKANLTLRWQSAVGLSDEKVAHMWAVDDAIFVTTSKGYLYEIDASSGKVLWNGGIYLGAHTRLFRPQFVGTNKDQVLVIGDGDAYVVDRRTGTELKNANLNFSPSSDPLAVNDLYLIGDLNDYFYGMYADLLNASKWKFYHAKDTFQSDPVLVEKNTSVIFASESGLVVKRLVDEGTQGWERQTNGQNVADLAADDQNVYVPTLNHRVYAFDIGNGNLAWNAFLSGRLDQAAVPVGKTILVAARENGLYALSKDDGSQQWFVPGVEQVITVEGQTIYAVNHDHNLETIDLASGDITGQVAVPKAQIYTHGANLPSIYVITKDGRIGAYDPAK